MLIRNFCLEIRIYRNIIDRQIQKKETTLYIKEAQLIGIKKKKKTKKETRKVRQSALPNQCDCLIKLIRMVEET